MRHRILAVAVVLAFSCSLYAQINTPPSVSELADISARGQAIAGHDAAAWHAGDAFAALNPDTNGIERYLARKTESGWVVVWGRFNEDHTKFLIVYEAKQGATPEAFTVAKQDPPLEDEAFYLHAAKAEDIALKTFKETKPTRTYNTTVLPAASGNWYVYLIPAQTVTTVLPYGGDIRYAVSGDGTSILETRQMHQIVLEERHDVNPGFGFHTHVLSDIPEDTDIFYAASRNAQDGEWLLTRKYFYELNKQGSIKYLGRTEAVLNVLEDKKCGTLPASIDLCQADRESIRLGVISLTRRLVSGTFPSQPFDAFPTFTGADCRNGSLFLGFEIGFHNFGQSPIVLHKDIGTKWVQARFGDTVANVMAGKYEKLVFYSSGESDISNPESFVVLEPGKTLTITRSFPVPQIDLHQKPIVQFLLYTWPLTKEGEAQKYREQWAKTGILYTEPITTGTVPLSIDSKLLDSCKE